MIIFIFFVTVWYTSLFCQSFFQHRYGAHAAFTMSRGWEKFFFIVTWITQGSSYLSPRAYAIMHRMHHAHTDTEDDPHSPSYSKNLMDMMIKTWHVYRDIYTEKTVVDAKYLKNVPDWRPVDGWAHSGLSRIIFAVAYLAFFIAFATSPWQYLLYPIILIMGPFHGAIINWFAHKYGYRNYEVKDTSENLLFFDFLMLGESYHNNHHKHPSDINFGKRWHEFDPIYPIIRVFAWVGIIQLPRAVVAR